MSACDAARQSRNFLLLEATATSFLFIFKRRFIFPLSLLLPYPWAPGNDDPGDLTPPGKTFQPGMRNTVMLHITISEQ